jgi:hypothetical protein
MSLEAGGLKIWGLSSLGLLYFFVAAYVLDLGGFGFSFSGFFTYFEKRTFRSRP